MLLRDLFRGLTGLPNRNSDENNNRDVWSNDPFYDLFGDFSTLLDETRRMYPPLEQPHADDDNDDADDAHDFSSPDDFNFQLFPEPSDMFRHFEEQLRRTFQSFGMMDFPAGLGAPPLEATPETPGGQPGSLRDRMLKPGPGVEPARERTDTDLDDRVSDGGLAALLDQSEPEPAPQRPVARPPRAHFSGASVTVQRQVGPDGRVEERRVETSSDGGRRETLTRRLGDREQTTVTTQRADGTTETEQHHVRPQHDNSPEFDRLWDDADSSRSDPPGGRRTTFDNSFWGRLFGS